MVKVSATALIYSISPVMELSANFRKREVILDDSWERDGVRHPNYILIEFTGENMAQLDNFAPGQRVTVEGMVVGREYNSRIYLSIRGKSIVPYQPQTQNAAPAPGAYPPQQGYQQAYGYAQQPTPAYPSQPSYPQQYMPPSAPVSAPPQQPYGPPPSPGVDDLPFSR